MFINADILDLYMRTTEHGKRIVDEVVNGTLPFKILYKDIQETLNNQPREDEDHEN